MPPVTAPFAVTSMYTMPPSTTSLAIKTSPLLFSRMDSNRRLKMPHPLRTLPVCIITPAPTVVLAAVALREPVLHVVRRWRITRRIIIDPASSRQWNNFRSPCLLAFLPTDILNNPLEDALRHALPEGF